jgi:hypothetical protein
MANVMGMLSGKLYLKKESRSLHSDDVLNNTYKRDCLLLFLFYCYFIT